MIIIDRHNSDLQQQYYKFVQDKRQKKTKKNTATILRTVGQHTRQFEDKANVSEVFLQGTL